MQSYVGHSTNRTLLHWCYGSQADLAMESHACTSQTCRGGSGWVGGWNRAEEGGTGWGMGRSVWDMVVRTHPRSHPLCMRPWFWPHSCLRAVACHRGWDSLVKVTASLTPTLPLPLPVMISCPARNWCSASRLYTYNLLASHCLLWVHGTRARPVLGVRAYSQQWRYLIAPLWCSMGSMPLLPTLNSIGLGPQSGYLLLLVEDTCWILPLFSHPIESMASSWRTIESYLDWTWIMVLVRTIGCVKFV